MQVHCLPIRIVSRIKGAAVRVELVREDEHPLVVGFIIRFLRVHIFWGVEINEPPISRDFSDLTGGVYTAKVESSLVCELFG
jgi:hypothetical protein